jgi:predicted CXXCH cytochrome family protein
VKGAGLTADTCAACHRAHTAKAPYLLKQSQETLCYTCHGASGTGSNEDVEDGVGYSGAGRTGTKGALRGGGFKYALIDSGNPSGNGYLGEIPTRATGAPVTSSHSVDASEQMAWGNGEISASPNYGKTVTLTCGSCHDPHGNGNYRILKPVPDESGAKPGVTIADISTKAYTTTNYWRVEDENAPSFIANISAWCATCHTRYLASANSGHTNSGDAVFAYRHRSDQTSQGSANCIQCHVAHGSNASMGTYSGGVDNPNGTAAAGDSRLLRIDNRGVCQMCHNK